MALVEINFDGIVGPSHNYAGPQPRQSRRHRQQGHGLASRARRRCRASRRCGTISRLGLAQGLLLPHRRPDRAWLAALGTDVEEAPDSLRPAAFSASAMWAANAATVSPAPDTADGRCHLTVANLRTMAHRSHEWPETLAQLRLAFADEAHFAVHPPVPATFGDEGAANHMRLCRRP